MHEIETTAEKVDSIRGIFSVLPILYDEVQGFQCYREKFQWVQAPVSSVICDYPCEIDPWSAGKNVNFDLTAFSLMISR